MTTSRIQLALNVSDVDVATNFYSDLFGVRPAKLRPGYANFVIADPPLKLVLFENPGAAGPLNHVGVEVASTADVLAAAGRFAAAGLQHTVPEADRCCHAVQDKVWVDAPDVPLGAWEFYTVTADDPGDNETCPTGSCCATTSSEATSCCAGTTQEVCEMVGQALVVDRVRVTFGATQALDDVSLRLGSGSTLAVLGHNGAGKTTLIRVLTTLLVPDRGSVLVDGVDALARPAEVRRRIGVTGQYAGLDDFLTTIENLELLGRLSGLRTAARGRAWDLVQRFELGAVATRRVGELSGGSRRRVDLAASLVASPALLFLDEPSTGLDPAARHALWEIVAGLTAAGTTVVLTTQYLEEADRLADEILVLNHGRVAGHGTPRELKARVGSKVVRATIPAHGVASLSHRPDATTPVGPDRVTVSFTVADADATTTLVSRLAADAVEVTDIEVASPSLDDVFFHLATTGVSR